MKLRLDNVGRLTIPKYIRNELGVEAGDLVEVNINDGILTIKGSPTKDLIETIKEIMEGSDVNLTEEDETYLKEVIERG